MDKSANPDVNIDDNIQYGCVYIPFTSDDNPCEAKSSAINFFPSGKDDISADEQEKKLFQFCGENVFGGNSKQGELTEEDIREIVTSKSRCSPAEVEAINEREIHQSFGADKD